MKRYVKLYIHIHFIFSIDNDKIRCKVSITPASDSNFYNPFGSNFLPIPNHLMVLLHHIQEPKYESNRLHYLQNILIIFHIPIKIRIHLCCGCWPCEPFKIVPLSSLSYCLKKTSIYTIYVTVVALAGRFVIFTTFVNWLDSGTVCIVWIWNYIDIRQSTNVFCLLIQLFSSNPSNENSYTGLSPSVSQFLSIDIEFSRLSIWIIYSQLDSEIV